MNDYKNQFIQALLGYAVARGIVAQHLCELSAIDSSALQKADNYTISPEQMNSLWRNAAQLSGDELFGLHFGESMQLAALGVIGQVIATSNTVGDALKHAGGFVYLITDLFQISTSITGDTCTVSLQWEQEQAVLYPHAFRHMSDFLMVFLLHELDGLILKKIVPSAVTLSTAPTPTAEHHRVFRTAVSNSTSESAISFHTSYLVLPIISANYELQKSLLQHMPELTTTAVEAKPFRSRIYNYLLANSYLYAMSLEAVAANFNMSPRSLQRRLKEEGVTFFQIVEEVRQKLAIHYLQSEKFKVKDVAYTLGYNEPSAFLKAFKRWTGTTPLKYRGRK